MSEIKACPLIKACPFCGFDTICEENHLIICLNCGTSNHISEWNTRPIEDALQARIAELEGKIDQLTARWRQERQDDKSSNDTQTETFVYGKESKQKDLGLLEEREE